MKVYICVAGRAHGWPEAGVPDRAHHQAGGVGPPLPRLPAPGPQAEIRPDEGGPAATAAAGGAARATTATATATSATEDQLSGSGQLSGGRTRHCFFVTYGIARAILLFIIFKTLIITVFGSVLSVCIRGPSRSVFGIRTQILKQHLKIFKFYIVL